MKPQLISGNSNPLLSAEIAMSFGKPLTPLFLKQFPSGESYCQIKENVRGDDVFIINGITQPANDNLMDTLIIADAARRASAARITAVLPYFGYARQDRKDKPRVPISAKLVMDLLAAAGVQRVLTMDLHSPQIAGFTNLPFDHLAFESVLTNFLSEKIGAEYEAKDVVIVAPDVGAVKRAEFYAKKLGVSLALIVKNRLSESSVEMESFVGEVNGKVAIIIDDLTESCGTLVQAATECKERGAKRVICAVTHFCHTGEGKDRLRAAMEGSKVIEDFVHSDTVNYPWTATKPKNIVKLSVAPLFARAIRNIHGNQSISELFN